MRVFITTAGPGRCGSTRLQLAMNALDGVYIAGQPTALPVDEIKSIHDGLLDRGAFAMESNTGKGYEHHIESDRTRARLAVRDFAEAVWFRKANDARPVPAEIRGAKLNGVSVNDPVLSTLWPEALFYVCVRHPWKTYISLINTFHPRLEWVAFSDKWADHVAAAVKNPFASLVKLEDPPDKTAERVARNLGQEGHAFKVSDRLRQVVHGRGYADGVLNESEHSASETFHHMAEFLKYEIKNGVHDV